MRFMEKGGAVFHGKQLSGSFVFAGNKAFCVLAVAQMEQVDVGDLIVLSIEMEQSLSGKVP